VPRITQILTGGLAAAALVLTVAACGGSDKAPPPPIDITLARGQETTVPFQTTAAGEVLLDVTTDSPQAAWETTGRESAVVSMSVDDRYATDVVIPASFKIKRNLALGSLPAGAHTLRLRFATDRSPAGTTSAHLTGFGFRTVGPSDAGYLAAQYAPVIYGRSGAGPDPSISGPFQNAVTDTPLVAFHTETTSPTTGNKVFAYSVVWSNEDGGTTTPALLARWGRTTDIEWIYQVEIDGAGRPVPGSAAVQGAQHSTVPFTGQYEGTHPVIQTCTLNNNICGKSDGQMRFSLAADQSLNPDTEARERIMDRNPWTYWVMSQETIREGKVADDPSTNPTQLIGDPRSYLYLVIRKSTVGTANTDNAWVGTSVGVKLAGNPTIYRSDGGVGNWSLERDQPAATAIALPPGTVAEDIEQIRALRVVGAGRDTRAKVQVESIERAFFLNADYQPQESFLFAPVNATLTASNPSATLVDRANGPIVQRSAAASGTATDQPSATPATQSPGITVDQPTLPALPTGPQSTPSATAPKATGLF
jgi:hypothetical protein